MNIVRILKKLNHQRLFWQRRLKQKRQLKQISPKQGPIDMSMVHEVFFPLIAYVGLGDIIFLSGVFKAFKKMGKTVVVAIPYSRQFIFDGIPYVDKMIFVDEQHPIAHLKDQSTDLIIDLYSRFDGGTLAYYQLLSVINCQYRIGFNVADHAPYNLTFKPPSPHAHITDAYQQLFLSLGLPQQDLAYDVHIPNAYELEAKAFLNDLKRNHPQAKIIALNPYASSTIRSLTVTQIESLLQKLGQKEGKEYAVVLLGESHKMAEIKTDYPYVHQTPFHHFWHAAAILAHSHLVISVDSAPVHLANAWHKPLVALYSSEVLNGLLGDTFYAPNYAQATQIIEPNPEARDMNKVYEAMVERLSLASKSFKTRRPTPDVAHPTYKKSRYS